MSIESTLPPRTDRPLLRMTATIAIGLVLLLGVVVAVRPEMMGMMREAGRLFVGFGL